MLILIIFRSPIAALLPVVVISVVMTVTTGLVAAAGKAFDFNVSQDLQTILLIVLFGIGTDYILFLLFRYRERLRAGDDKRTAMVVPVQRVGEVITSAAGAVIVAFLVLLLASLGFFGSLGPALAIAVGVMLVTVADPDPGARVAARPVGVLAVEGVAARTEGDPVPAARRRRRPPPGRRRRGLRRGARRARRRGARLQGRLRLRRRIPAGHRVGAGRQGPPARLRRRCARAHRGLPDHRQRHPAQRTAGERLRRRGGTRSRRRAGAAAGAHRTSPAELPPSPARQAPPARPGTGNGSGNGPAAGNGSAAEGAARLSKGRIPKPKYPDDCLRAAQEGRVVVTFTVDEQGNVVGASYLRSPYPSMDQAALDAVCRGKFPSGPRAVASKAIVFTLKNR